MDSVPTSTRAVEILRRAIGQILFRVRRILGMLAQSVQRDELRELTNEARVLGSASAESINHVGAELREINERLAKLEHDIERIGHVLEDEGAREQVVEKQSETPAQSLSTD
jgi:hypothetical protein